MTDAATPATPVYGSPQAYQQLSAPAGTSWNTPWIWMTLVIALLSYGTLFLYDFGDLFSTLARDPTNSTAILQSVLSPRWIIAGILPWVLIVIDVVLSYLDWRELGRRGVPKPFHWAFAFLGVVYPIGRAIITNRRGIGGMAVLWVTIGIYMLGLIISSIWSFFFMNEMLALMIQFSGVRP